MTPQHRNSAIRCAAAVSFATHDYVFDEVPSLFKDINAAKCANYGALKLLKRFDMNLMIIVM